MELSVLALACFWGSLGLLAYVYVGYPVCVAALGAMLKRHPRRAPITPRVTILIPAYNEARDLARTIENKLDLDYPKEKLEILVISDASTDATDAIVRRYADRGVRLIRQEPRQGKTAGLNLAVPQVGGEILVFSDANSLYARDAVQALVSPFADPQVGYVTGKMIYVNPDGSVIGDGCSAYMKYENLLRRHETRLGSVVGVDGGIDAMRKRLYRPIRPDLQPDLVLPLQVVTQGSRVVYESHAVLREETLSDSGSEYRMRVRVTLRALWALFDMRRLLNPLRYPLYAWQLWSHKVLRYLAVLPMLVTLGANLMLLDRGPFYVATLSLQCAFYLAAAGGVLLSGSDRRPYPLAFPYYFVLINTACAHALWRFLRGEKQVIWQPRTG
jgi:glycosyltransferase involved in cell wall biosynthesis